MSHLDRCLCRSGDYCAVVFVLSLVSGYAC